MTAIRTVTSVIVVVIAGSLCTAMEEPLDPKSIRRAEGFEIELLRKAGPKEDSWISMTLDDRGRVILGLDKLGVARLTLTPGKIAKFDRIDSSLKHCRGVLFAHKHIYVNSTDSKVLVRFSDLDRDDKFETTKQLIKFDYRSRYGHGANQMRLGPDGKVYVVVGNDVSFPPNVSPNSAYANPRNDWLLPEKRDLGQDDRVGYILRMDPDGSNREIVAGGFRNPVDMDFDPNGEMFTFDADMEWDIGTPWYRPIRVNHIVSGGDYGWRWGTGKWPAYFPDSLPSNLDVGMGSPTGVTFGTRSNFPARYKNALFIADWQNGKVFAAFPKHDGASYQFEYESFLDGAPLNVCDMEFGPDGNLYFITGGRGSQSALYRVSWTGKKNEKKKGTLQASQKYPPLNPLQIRRLKLESMHKTPNRRSIEFAWKDLGHTDPWIRNAARIAIERQPVTTWEHLVFQERDFDLGLAALMALVRTKKTDAAGQAGFRAKVIGHLKKLMRKSHARNNRLSSQRLIGLIRTCGLLFARHGHPDPKTAQLVFDEFHKFFPSGRESLDKELCELLVFTAGKTDTANQRIREFRIKAFAKLSNPNLSQETQIHIARSLAHLPQPWTNSESLSFANWLVRANAFRGGHLLPNTIIQMRTDFESKVNASSSSNEFKSQIATKFKGLQSGKSTTKNSNRDLVKKWTFAELEKIDSSKGDSRTGLKIFVEAQCSNCHRKGDVGSMIGPDLTNVAGRFSKSALLESILSPSSQIDPKYALSTYGTVDGKTHTGRVHGVNAKTITLEVDPILQRTVTLKRDEIESTRPSKTSPMPTGLLNYFTKTEIIDLMAYLLER